LTEGSRQRGFQTKVPAMRRLCKAAVAMAVGFGLSAANAQSANPACQRLEAQLATLNQGNADPARADQIRRTEDTVNRQQLEVDRLVAQSRRIGCQNSGFFSIFSNPPQQCGALNRQIDQQRVALERMRNQLEQLNGGNTERAAQRQALLVALGNNGCGPQYRSEPPGSSRAPAQGGRRWRRLDTVVRQFCVGHGSPRRQRSHHVVAGSNPATDDGQYR